MRNNIWKKSILMMIPIFVILPLVNMVAAAGFSSSNDMAITSQVNDKLQSDSELQGSQISVETFGGEVTLKGMVNSQADIIRAGQLAGWVDGVKNVDNRLTTFSSHHYGAKPGMTDCQIGANWC